jgi:hypothetical protein
MRQFTFLATVSKEWGSSVDIATTGSTTDESEFDCDGGKMFVSSSQHPDASGYRFSFPRAISAGA